MSWYRQIKILYTICNNTFFFILWATSLGGFFGEKTDYKLFLLSLCTAFSLAFLLEKTYKVMVAATCSLIASEVLLFLIYGGNNLLINSSYICIILFVTYKNEIKDVNYEKYKYKAKQGIVTLVVLGLIFSLAKLSNAQSILKFYIIFLIATCILMREARNYYYNLKNRKSFISNIAIAIGIVVISLDSVFNIVLICLRFLGNVFYKIADELNTLIAIAIRKKFTENPNLIKNINDSQNKPQNKIENAPNLASITGLPTWFTGTIKVIILLILVYFLYRLIYKYKHTGSRNSKEVLVEREKISKEKSHSDNLIRRAVKSILRLSDLREQAINVYKKFEQKTNEKGIFRRHMTAMQLEIITKTYIENPEGLNNLTDIYNEAKFSTHKVTKERVEAIKDSLNKVKKQL
jgi:hypothetical protein